MISKRNEYWVDDATTVRRIHPRVDTPQRKWWHGLGATILSLGLFACSGLLLRTWDPTAAVLDIGILSMLPLALLAVALARLATYGIYKPMVESINELTRWQQTLCYGCLYVSHFWAVVWVMVSLI